MRKCITCVIQHREAVSMYVEGSWYVFVRVWESVDTQYVCGMG